MSSAENKSSTISRVALISGTLVFVEVDLLEVAGDVLAPESSVSICWREALWHGFGLDDRLVGSSIVVADSTLTSGVSPCGTDALFGVCLQFNLFLKWSGYVSFCGMRKERQKIHLQLLHPLEKTNKEKLEGFAFAARRHEVLLVSRA